MSHIFYLKSYKFFQKILQGFLKTYYIKNIYTVESRLSGPQLYEVAIILIGNRRQLMKMKIAIFFDIFAYENVSPLMP